MGRDGSSGGREGNGCRGGSIVRAAIIAHLSECVELRQVTVFGSSRQRDLARFVKTQNCSRGVDVETFELFSHVIQVSCGDAVFFCAEKQQGHRSFPLEVEGFGEDQCQFTAAIGQCSFHHVDGQ